MSNFYTFTTEFPGTSNFYMLAHFFFARARVAKRKVAFQLENENQKTKRGLGLVCSPPLVLGSPLALHLSAAAHTHSCLPSARPPPRPRSISSHCSVAVLPYCSYTPQPHLMGGNARDQPRDGPQVVHKRAAAAFYQKQAKDAKPGAGHSAYAAVRDGRGATRRGCVGGCTPRSCASTWRAPRRTRRCKQ